MSCWVSSSSRGAGHRNPPGAVRPSRHPSALLIPSSATLPRRPRHRIAKWDTRGSPATGRAPLRLCCAGAGPTQAGSARDTNRRDTAAITTRRLGLSKHAGWRARRTASVTTRCMVPSALSKSDASSRRMLARKTLPRAGCGKSARPVRDRYCASGSSQQAPPNSRDAASTRRLYIFSFGRVIYKRGAADTCLEFHPVIPSRLCCHPLLRPCGRFRRPSGQRLHLSGCLNSWDHF